MRITAAGYIVHDNEGVIHGIGASVDAAWADAEKWVETLAGLKVMPASAALLATVSHDGGNRPWGKLRGVACTVGEETAGADAPQRDGMPPSAFRSYLYRLHWTQRGFANLLDVPHNTVHRWALGEARVPEHIGRFLKACDRAVLEAKNEVLQ